MTLQEIAQQLDMSRSTLHDYLHAPGAPKPTADGYDLNSVTSFIKEKSAQTLPSLTDASTRLKIAQSKLKCEKLAIKAKVESGELIPKATLGPAITKLFLKWRIALQHKFEDELPPKLVGLNEDQIRDELTKALNELHEMLLRGIEHLLRRN